MEPYGAIRAEAQRWLGIAVKLLSGRDLVGSKTFAIRARESDPRLEFADQILAVADTLIAGEKRINNQPDWYAILQLVGRTHDSEIIASQYRRLALLLNPHQNNLPFADLAFKLVCDAWLVLSNPSRKSLYDNEINFISIVNNPVGSSREQEYRNQQQQEQQQLNRHHQHQQQWQQPPPPQQQPPTPSRPQQMQPPLARPVPQQPPPSRPVPQQPLPSRPVPQPPVQSRQEPPRVVQPEPPQRVVQPEPPKRVVQPEPHKQQQQSKQKQQEAAVKQNPRKVIGNETEEVDNGINHPNGGDGDESPSFWTACPYCYNMYEYPKVYAECTLRCQNCKRAFQAVPMLTRPPNFEGKEGYFSCWGFFPLGVSVSNSQKKKGRGSKWTPFSPMFTLPGEGQDANVGGLNNVNSGAPKNPKVWKSPTPRVYVDDEQDAYVEVSEGSDDTDDDDWRRSTKRKKAKSARGKSLAGRPPKQPQGDKAKHAKGGGGENLQGGVVMKEGVRAPNVAPAESSKKAMATNTRRQSGRGAKELGKLDLNVEFSNEVEEHAPGMSEGNGHGGAGHREEDNIEGMFFEGLDEFLSSLPILVGDDKVKAA